MKQPELSCHIMGIYIVTSFPCYSNLIQVSQQQPSKDGLEIQMPTIIHANFIAVQEFIVHWAEQLGIGVLCVALI